MCRRNEKMPSIIYRFYVSQTISSSETNIRSVGGWCIIASYLTCYLLFYFINSEMCPGKIDVSSFVLCIRGTPSLAPPRSKMQKIIVYKNWSCSTMIVVNLGFPCLYFALSRASPASCCEFGGPVPLFLHYLLAMVVVRQSRFKTYFFGGQILL